MKNDWQKWHTPETVWLDIQSWRGISIGAALARAWGVPKNLVLAFPADWNKYDNAAGPIRNRQMLTEGKPTMVLAFHYKLLVESKGTKDMVKMALGAGLPVYL